jgi:ribosomal protein S27E
MMKGKRQFKIRCPDCDKEIIGFSRHHAEQNLMIHQKTSIRCREFRELLRKKGYK